MRVIQSLRGISEVSILGVENMDRNDEESRRRTRLVSVSIVAMALTLLIILILIMMYPLIKPVFFFLL